MSISGTAGLYRRRPNGTLRALQHLAVPDALHVDELLLEQLAPVAELRRRDDGVVLAPADRESQREPSVRDGIYRCGLLGEHTRVAHGREQDGRHEAQAPGDGRHCREFGHRLEVVVRQPVERRERGVRPLVGAPRQLRYIRPTVRRHPEREPNANLHALTCP